MLVPRAGLEPARILLRGILSPLCLPIPPPGEIGQGSHIISSGSTDNQSVNNDLNLLYEPFFILHIYYIIFFYKNQIKFFGSGAENRTQTSGFRDPRTNQYTTPQYVQDTIKNNNGALPAELLPYIGRGGRDSNPRHPAWKANF